MKIKVLLGVVAIIVFTSLVFYNFGNSIPTYVDCEGAQGMKGAYVVATWEDTQEVISRTE